MSETGPTDNKNELGLEKLQGTWRTIRVEVDGSPLAPWLFENSRLVIEGNRFTLRNPLPDADQSLEGVLSIDASKDPAELNLTLDGGQVLEEILELELNTLTVCYPTKGGRRPSEFKSVPQSDLSLVVYERLGGTCI